MTLPNFIHVFGKIRKLQVRIRGALACNMNVSGPIFARIKYKTTFFFNISYTRLHPEPKKGSET